MPASSSCCGSDPDSGSGYCCTSGWNVTEPGNYHRCSRAGRSFRIDNLVVDPVMVSRTGAQLIDDAAVETSGTPSFLWQVVTPNRYEAQLLSGLEIHTLDDMKVAAQRIHQPASRVSQRGGMAGIFGVDVWFDGHHLETLTTALVDTTNTHGTAVHLLQRSQPILRLAMNC